MRHGIWLLIFCLPLIICESCGGSRRCEIRRTVEAESAHGQPTMRARVMILIVLAVAACNACLLTPQRRSDTVDAFHSDWHWSRAGAVLALLKAAEDRSLDPLLAEEHMKLAVLERDASALPFLLEALSADPSGASAELAALGLAYFGGETAVDALRQAYTDTANYSLKSLLCFAMASTGRPHDIDFLIASLESQYSLRSWASKASAAYALGVLGAAEAMRTLREVASGSRAPAGAARRAIWWITDRPAQPDFFASENLRNQLIEQVLSWAVLPDGPNSLYTADTSTIWRRERGTWRPLHRSGGRAMEADRLPRVSFDVHLSTDQRRALIQVSFTFSMYDGGSYDYLLRRTVAGWQVIGIRHTFSS